MSATAEATMAMPHGNAADDRADDQPSSELAIKAPGAMIKGGNAARTVTEDVRRAWVFTLAPTPVEQLLARLRNPTVPGDNGLLKLLYRAFLVVWALPLTLAGYGFASAQQSPSRAVVVDGAIVGLVLLWLL